MTNEEPTNPSPFLAAINSVGADAFRFMQCAQSQAPQQGDRMSPNLQQYHPSLQNQPLRCECHACTQARVSQWEWKLDVPAKTDTQKIAEAVLAERERCAKIAEEIADDPHGSNPSCSTAELIAAKIREGK